MADHDSTNTQDRILTFRTITTLLEILQCLNAPRDHRQFPLLRGYSTFTTNSDHDECLAALATLLARDREFTAVSITQKQNAVWELTVCHHEERPKATATTIPSPQMTASDARSSTIRAEEFSILTPDACDIDPSNPFPYIRKTW